MLQKVDKANIIVGDTVNDVVLEAIQQCMTLGELQESRGGQTRSLEDVTMIVRNPRARHLNIPGRTSNPFQLVGETFWVIAGHYHLYPYLTAFVPRAPQYSNDGVTWHDAYGPRLFGQLEQMQGILELLRADINSRQGYATITDPTLDSQSVLEERGIPKSARPCNNGIYFWVKNNRLNMKVVQRSGDLIFGAGSINLFEFSVIHEIMYELLKQTHEDLELGEYRHNTINLHIYLGDEKIEQQVENILRQNGFGKYRDHVYNEERHFLNIGLGEGVTNWTDVTAIFDDFVTKIGDIYGSCKHQDKVSDGHFEEIQKAEADFLSNFEEESIMVDYAGSVTNYLISKVDPEMCCDLAIPKESQLDDTFGIPKYGFDRAIIATKFRKFLINIEV